MRFRAKNAENQAKNGYFPVFLTIFRRFSAAATCFLRPYKHPIFHAMEKYFTFFPRYGKKFSTPWKQPSAEPERA